MNKKILISMLMIALTVPLGTALAENSSGSATIKAQREQNRQNLKDQKEKNKQALLEAKQKKWQTRCKNIENRINTRINRYENSGHMFETVYGNMLARLQRLVERLKAKNVDVAKLETDLATLKTKIDKLLADQATFMATLNSLKPVTCDQTSEDPAATDQTTTTDLKTKSGEARKIIATIRQDKLDIRNFYQSTIKPDILAIRKQLAQQKTNTETNTNTGTTSNTETETNTTTSTTTSTSASASVTTGTE